MKAQHNVGIMYEKGIGVKKNHKKAAKWLKKAATQGFTHSKYMLGVMHMEGRKGVPQSYKKAGKWFKKAGKNWNKDSTNLFK